MLRLCFSKRSRSSVLWLALAFLAFYSGLPSAASARTFYVAASGNDDGPGTFIHPWATINHAAETVAAGDTAVLRGGTYTLTSQVRPKHSGHPHAWITFVGYPGENPVFDANFVPYSSLHQGDQDNGAFQIEGVSYIRVVGLTVTRSHDAGFTVRDASHIDIINNTTSNTFSSGIAAWDTKHEGRQTKFIRILGNTIERATIGDLAPPDWAPGRGAPQEAMSIAGAIHFVVAYNHVYDGENEGIDIKETSKFGQVYANLVSDMGRQAMYADAWFGDLATIEIFSNVLSGCRGAGLALSVEEGRSLHDIDIHDNLIVDNAGTGLLFSRWGRDGPRWKVRIHNNIVYHNGFGAPRTGQRYYWITGGLYLYSNHLHNILIKNNVVSHNRGFQIGYSALYLKGAKDWPAAAVRKAIRVIGNSISGDSALGAPIEAGGYPPDHIKIYATNGESPVYHLPQLRDSKQRDSKQYDFSLRGDPASWPSHPSAPVPKLGSRFWLKGDFPPKLVRIHLLSAPGHKEVRAVRVESPL